MFLLKRPDHMRCGHASIPRFPTLVGMLYQNALTEFQTLYLREVAHKERPDED